LGMGVEVLAGLPPANEPIVEMIVPEG